MFLPPNPATRSEAHYLLPLKNLALFSHICAISLSLPYRHIPASPILRKFSCLFQTSVLFCSFFSKSRCFPGQSGPGFPSYSSLSVFLHLSLCHHLSPAKHCQFLTWSPCNSSLLVLLLFRHSFWASSRVSSSSFCEP